MLNSGIPIQSSSFLIMVVWMLVRRSSSLLIFLKSKKYMFTFSPTCLPQASMSSLSLSNPGSSTSMTTLTDDMSDRGSSPVGTLLANFASLFLWNIFRMLSNIMLYSGVLDAISSRISFFAAFQRGMSIFVPTTSTTFAAMMEPTSPQTLSGIPREWA